MFRIRPVHRLTACTLLTACTMIVGLAFLTAGPGWAQEDEPPVTYTRVELWQVKRAKWSDFEKDFEKYDQPVLEKMFADGLITEWGIDSQVLHTPDGYTHSTWYSADSMGALAKAGEVYLAAFKEMENADQLRADFAAMITKHRDYIIDTEGMRSSKATLDKGYFHGQTVNVTRGKHRQFHSYWNHRQKPIYEKLLKDGTIVSFGLSTETITTEHPMSHTWWYVVPDAEGLDKVRDAFEASWDDMDDEGQRARWASIMDVVDEDSYREWMTSVIRMAIEEH